MSKDIASSHPVSDVSVLQNSCVVHFKTGFPWISVGVLARGSSRECGLQDNQILQVTTGSEPMFSL